MTAITGFPSPLRHELTQEQWEEILVWCAEQQASDIVLCPDDKIWMQKDGVWYAVTDSSITDAEIQYMVNVTSGQSNRAGYVRAGHSLDYAFGLRVPGQRGVRQRFRVNATSSNKGIYVVLRILPRTLPVLEDMQLPGDLVENLYPEAGLVVISGVMGSGKSTLLAAALNRALLPSGPARQILTLEDPIEFDFSSIPCQERSAPITQSAIGTDVEDWAGGVRTLTRRKGEIVMVGECRDRETISSLLSTVEQGVTAYTTVHAQDVAQTLTRIIHLFRKEERDSAMAVLFANIRLIIHQRLVPRKRTEAGKTGRIALREYLACDRDIRSLLYELDAARLIEGVRSLVGTYGHSLLKDAREKHARGLIDDEVLQSIVREQEGRKPAYPASPAPGSSYPGPSFPGSSTPGPSSGPSPMPCPSSGPSQWPSQAPSGGPSHGTSNGPFQWPTANSSINPSARPSAPFPSASPRPSNPSTGSSLRPSQSSSQSSSSRPSQSSSQIPVRKHVTGHVPGHFPGHFPGNFAGRIQGSIPGHFPGGFPGPGRTSSQASGQPSQASAQPSGQQSAQSSQASAQRPARQHMAGVSFAGASKGASLAGSSTGASLAGSSLEGPSGQMPHAPVVRIVPAGHAAQAGPDVPVPGKPVLAEPVPGSPVLTGPVLAGPVPAGPSLTGSGIQPLPPQSDSGEVRHKAPSQKPQSGSGKEPQKDFRAAASPCPGPQTWPWQGRPGGPGSPAGCTA